MNRQQIIKMAREAGLGEHLWYTTDESEFAATERFFHMAQAAEREACIKIVSDNAERYGVAVRLIHERGNK